jgi:hypothetical protein
MQTSAPSAAPLASIGIGKDTFHIAGFDTNGSIAFRRQIKRLALVQIWTFIELRHRCGGRLQ